MTCYPPERWHTRFLQQARWTASLRTYLIEKGGFGEGSRILDVGCGTGAILTEIEKLGVIYHGLDISYSNLRYTLETHPRKTLIHGDALELPIANTTYDAAICHFLLMWVSNPGSVVAEMARVTKPGGWVMAFAEPDYGGRIDYPPELNKLGKFQIKGLLEQGANPCLGRSLASVFHDAGLLSIETGVLGGQWSGPPDWDAWETEWQVLKSDLRMQSDLIDQVDKLQDVDRKAYEAGKRVLFVPTFYAIGIAK